jgi:hypothetical protein
MPLHFEEVTMHITTPGELAAQIREAFIGCDRMEVDIDTIADRLFRRHTFGGDLNYRRGKATLTGLRMAVAMFFEREYEETGATDDPKRDEAIERAQELLDAVTELAELQFTLSDLDHIRPLDPQRFYRLLLGIPGCPSELLGELYRKAEMLAGEPEDEDVDAGESDTEEAAQ